LLPPAAVSIVRTLVVPTAITRLPSAFARLMRAADSSVIAYC